MAAAAAAIPSKSHNLTSSAKRESTKAEEKKDDKPVTPEQAALLKELAGYDKSLRVRPNDATTLNNRGLTLSDLGRHEEALASYDHSLRVRPNDADTLSNRGDVLSALGRHEEALASYEHSLRVLPNNADTLYNRGTVLSALGRHEEALASYEHSLRVRPNHADTLYNRGTILSTLGRHKEALANYDHSLRVLPNNAGTLTNRGAVLTALGRNEEALASYEHSLRVLPNNADTLYNRGAVLRTLGRNEEALASYEHSLRVRPNDAGTLHNQGAVLSDLGRHEEALASYDHSLRVHPNDAGTLYNRGTMLSTLGRLEEALANYDHSLRVRPNDADTLNNRGLTLSKLGRNEEALASYDHSLRVRPNHAGTLNDRGNVLKALDQHKKLAAKQGLLRDQKKPLVFSPAPAKSSPMLSPVPTSPAAPAAKREAPPLRAVSFHIPYTELTFGKELGRGGLGIVYQGIWRHTDVAIKQLLATELSETAVEEFKQEGAMMARLRSPHIVQLYGYCVSPQYAIVMEYLPKGSLFKLLHSKTPFAWEQRYRVITDIACGLAYLHSDRIFHRDIKSLNILLHGEEPELHAKLCDFGLSQIKLESKATTKGRSVGTPAWIAPERMRRTPPPYTAKADMYSFGITLWEVAAREIPFKEVEDAMLPVLVTQGEREEIPTDCPPKLASIIRHCWEGDPDKRPTATAVARFLLSTETDFRLFATAPSTPALPAAAGAAPAGYTIGAAASPASPLSSIRDNLSSLPGAAATSIGHR